jgi:hypothetical protein
MNKLTAARCDAVNRYIRTGEYNELQPAWTGSIPERARQANVALLDALVAEVFRRTVGKSHLAVPAIDLVPWTRAKLTPMVHGLFAAAERDLVLTMLEASVVFLTSDTIERILKEQTWLHSAWTLANLYLHSVGADLLGPDARPLLGLSEGTTCYVSAKYFASNDGLEDFVLHEAAHVFHNCKRRTVGLPETRTREWLLPVVYGKRETFAYACVGLRVNPRAHGEAVSSGARWPRRWPPVASARGRRPSTPRSSPISSGRHARRATGGRSSCAGARRRGTASADAKPTTCGPRPRLMRRESML